MAMVQLANGVEDINGQVGGNVWRYDVCGFHIQKAPGGSIGFRVSPQQKAFGRCTSAWSNHSWLQLEIDRWWRWCDANPTKNKKGETRYYHPFLAFLSVNIKRILVGKEIIYQAP